MAKNLNVSLAFTADASQAKTELNALKKSLNELVSGTTLKTPDFQFTKDIQEATKAAAQLKVQLEGAINPKTGNLDLTKFNESMKKSGMSLEQYQNQLYSLGPAGEKAFADLAKSITLADVPLRRSSKLLNELWTTMKNTARWQLTSSAMHGFMGAVQTAYRYAQDLNGSLNEIRIVTGASVDKMAEFAKYANDSAKALSTTTKAYTDASLIYYQQGLSDKEVKERTDITIKMANAAGTSVEETSNQLTGIWNNFYDGTKSLEHYADVMTALGAATASSTEEIAGGLEKFAAIGKTIGLSYEYAAAALATITSNTRESEEVVGTALKTIFARIQGLNLGETLDDGTTLNKYSEALQKVGISIFDNAGELKNMDIILNEMAAKWDELNNSQQVALAQTVAGVRQYNQLMALMNNWDNGDGDSMMANLDTANNASGTLQYQADIYAESWEAASKRVQASTEAVYTAILNDEFFIDLTNGFAGLIDGVKTFIDSLGGIKGILFTIGSLVTSIFSKQITKSIGDAIYSIKGFIAPKKMLEKELATKQKANDLLISGEKDKANTSGSQNAEIQSALGQQQQAYIANASRMTEEEMKLNQMLMDQNQLLADGARKAGEELQAIEEKIILEEKSLEIAIQRAGAKNGKQGDTKYLKETIKDATRLQKVQSTISAASAKVEIIKGEPVQATFEKIKKSALDAVKAITQIDDYDPDIQGYKALADALSVTEQEAQQLYQALKNSSDMSGLREALSGIETTSITSSEAAIQRLKSALVDFGIEGKEADAIMTDYVNAVQSFGPQSTQAIEALNKLKDGVSKLSNDMNKAKTKPMELGQAFSKAAGAVMAVGQAISTIQGIINVFNDEQSTTGDKIMALVSGIGMLIPTILAIAPAFSTASVGATLFGTTATAAGTAASLAMWQVTLIVAAITAIIAIVAILVSQQESAEKKAKEAAKAAEAATESLEEAKEAADALRDSFNDYNEAVDKLKECTKGTKEWEAALRDVNDAALEVIENLPDNLTADEIKNLYTTENGYMELKSDEIEKYQTRANNSVMAAQMSKAVADKMAVDTTVQVDLKNALQDLWDGGYAANISNYGTDKLSEQLFNNLDSLQGLDIESLQAKLKSLGISVSDLGTNDLMAFSQVINECAASTEGASEKMKLIIGIELDEKFGGLENAERTGLTNITAVAEDKYAKDYYKILTGNDGNAEDEAAWKALYGNSNYGGINQAAKSDNAVFQQIMSDAAKYGLNWEAGSDNAVQGDDSNRTFYLSIDGGDSKNYSARDIANKLSSARALYETGAGLDEVKNILSELNKQDGAGALESLMATGNISVDNLADLNSVANGDLATKMQEAYKGLDATSKQMLLQAYDVDSIDVLIQKINDQTGDLAELQTQLQSTGTLQFGIDNEMSLDAAKELHNTLSDIEKIGTGNISSEHFLGKLTEMVSGIEDPEKKAEALNQLATLDWSSWNAMDQAALIVEDFGGSIDLTEGKWTQFADKVRKATLAFPEYDNLKNTMQEISGIVNELEMGSVISDEDYEKLIAYNAALKDLFILQADGTRVFIGDSEVIKESTEKNLQSMREDLELRKKRAQAVKDEGAASNFDALSIDERWGDGKDGQLSTTNSKLISYWNGKGENLNKFTSGEQAMDYAIAAEGQKAWDSEAIRTILQDQGYSQEDWTALIEAAKDGSTEGLQAALDFVSQYVNEDFEQADIELDEMMASTATSIDELNQLLAEGQTSPAAYSKQLQYLTNAGMAAATSLSELYSIVSQGLENGATIDYSAYADALMRIGGEYSNATAEVGRYQQALESGNEKQIESTQAQLEAAIQAGEMAERYGLTAEHIERYADELKASGKYAKANEKALTNMAKDQLRFDKAVVKAADNMETWTKDLKVAEKTGHLVSESADGMAEAYGDLLDIDGSELSSDFLKNTKNLEDMQKALEGDEEAYRRLQEAARKDIATRIGIDDAEFQAGFADLMSKYYEGQTLDDIEVGAALDNAGFLQGLTDMVNAAGMTAQEATDYLSSMGVDAEVVTEPETVEEVQGYNLVATPSTTSIGYNPGADAGGPATATFPSVTYEATPVTTTKTVQGTALKVTSASKSSGGGVKHGGSTSANGGSNGGGGGGGGSKTKPTADARGKKTDIVDRYKEVDDRLDDVRKRMDDASKAADRLWGPARLAQMQKVNGALKEEISELKKKKQEADKNLKTDKTALNSAASDLGISFTYDDGNISNYEAQMTKVYEKREALLDSFGAEMDESEEEQLTKFDEDVQALKDAIAQYDETRELSEDLSTEIQDKIYEWQDNNYEQLNYKLEFELEINDSEMEILDYYLDKIEGDIYSTAEAFGYMKGQVDIYNDNLAQQESYVAELNRAYYAGEISMDAYKEGLREAQSATIENLQALQEQKEAMQDYYGNVMEMALEEIALYTDEMEELNSVLDHYSNILELVGKQEDYATKGKVLQSKAANLRNEMQVQQELYEKSNAEAEKWAAKMATAIEGSNEYETYKKNWIAAQEAANEAQDNMLSKTEEWAEAMKAVVENELAGLAKTMEESLTGGTSFDELLTSMERRSSLQEEYLTTTNQIYETNKLMRQAQQEIDKTTNSVAKRKLANFISETEQMQEQSELSQYELDIQQAKYDLLLAEIALEEAQSAKSTVRLQRDSEGNFGYVYTADQSAVGEAEQELADKQNALYNLGLEGANDYSQKYAETMQEAQDAITELTQMWMNGEIESEEEYQRRKAEIQDYYYEKLKQYSSLYQVALTTDSNVIKDAWSTDFGDMMYKTEDWKASVDTYFEGAAESMKTWAEVCGTVLEESGLDDVSKKVEEIDTKSNKLKETLIGEDGESGVVGAMMSEVEAAGKLSEAYIGIQNQIDEVIKKYEEMMGVINEDYTNENTPEVDPAIDPEPEPEPPTDPEPPETPAAEGPTYQTGTLTWTGNGASRIWKDSTGKTYKYGSPEQKAIQKAFDRAYGANGGYKGDYWGGWNKLNADVLHKKYGLATGGYTGDWDGSYGKLAFLHQKELVLNANDTENFLQAMDILDKIVSAIDLYSMNSQLGGALSSPSLGSMGGGEVLEQQVHIEASFPGVQDRNEIEEAFNTLINRASQYANRK